MRGPCSRPTLAPVPCPAATAGASTWVSADCRGLAWLSWQIVGRVEAKEGGGRPEVVIRSEYGEFKY